MIIDQKKIKIQYKSCLRNVTKVRIPMRIYKVGNS